MFGMVGIGESFEILVIARGTADVLGRATTGGSEKHRVRKIGYSRLDPLDGNGMVTIIAEVVDI